MEDLRGNQQHGAICQHFQIKFYNVILETLYNIELKNENIPTDNFEYINLRKKCIFRSARVARPLKLVEGSYVQFSTISIISPTAAPGIQNLQIALLFTWFNLPQ